MTKKRLQAANELPEGWTIGQIRELADHYGMQSEKEALQEDEGQQNLAGCTMVSVPNSLVPKVRRLLNSANAKTTNSKSPGLTGETFPNRSKSSTSKIG